MVFNQHTKVVFYVQDAATADEKAKEEEEDAAEATASISNSAQGPRP